MLTPREAVERVLFDTDREILDRQVRVDGFAVLDEETGGWYVARISLACCAADGVAYRILVEDAPFPGTDQWVSVTGVIAEPGGATEGLPIPRLAAAEVVPFDTPANTYD